MGPSCFEVLLVEDNPADADLTVESFEDAKFPCNVHVVGDGVEAMKFVRRMNGYKDAPHPDLILLDLNMPGKDGRKVLAELKSDGVLRRIPVVVMTSSQSEVDLVTSYNLHANAFITKPIDLEGFDAVVKAVGEFWFDVVKRAPA